MKNASSVAAIAMTYRAGLLICIEIIELGSDVIQFIAFTRFFAF